MPALSTDYQQTTTDLADFELAIPSDVPALIAQVNTNIETEIGDYTGACQEVVTGMAANNGADITSAGPEITSGATAALTRANAELKAITS